ncbi:hypothetical protein TWF694_008890 [Orbilia ellipsospora]|uniref:Nucleoside phosphorylase domain-containing protein n=1 Tax=Orbilia ellipsospora TaxID=2528407 RepID=A0AAV9XE83_9PEZI
MDRSENLSDHEVYALNSSYHQQSTHGDFDDDIAPEFRTITPSPSRDRYVVAWICALAIEMAAARAMLDEVHKGFAVSENDSNTYILGRIGCHNIVIACLPYTLYGTNNAANVLTNLLRTFPSIRLGLMVGIGGGVPSMADIRLGDIVVGTRVMQYDLGKVVQEGKIRRTAIPKTPHQLFGTAVSVLRAEHELKSSRVTSILREKMGEYVGWSRPRGLDRVFAATYEHAHEALDCDQCDKSKLLPRRKRGSNNPVIHYGVIASGNQVMKSGIMRDSIARGLEAICFEMETAGLMDILPCLPIRGICDYSDSHKNKEWQKYAAATAAAYAKELLDIIPALEAPRNSVFTPRPQGLARPAGRAPHRGATMEFSYRNQLLLNSLRYEQINARKVDIRPAHAKTCRWFLNHPDYQVWLDPTGLMQHRGLLWIKGKPGAGKSTVMKFLYTEAKKQPRRGHTVIASFFFNARGKYLEKSISGMYRSLLLQLLEGYPDLQTVFDDTDLVPRNQTECPRLNVLKDLFFNAVSGLGQRLFTCFVDALDECDEQEMRNMIQDVEELADISTEKNIPFRICFSSRHYPYISIRWGIQLTLENQQGHAEDLATYVGNRLEIKDTMVVEELRSRILEKAAGVFLWVVLVVNILNKENRRGRMALKKRLAELPSGLSDLFKDMLKRDQENMEDFLLSILWVLYARRPLTPEEYYHAMWSGLHSQGLADDEIPSVTGSYAGETIRNCVVSSSKGLAEVTKDISPRVQFIHESVRDFLIKDKGLHELWPDLGFDWDSPSNERLKEYCCTYMNHPSIVSYLKTTDSQSRISKQYPFLEYTCENVFHHANTAAIAVPQHDFLFQFPVRRWAKLHDIFDEKGEFTRTIRNNTFDENETFFSSLSEGRWPKMNNGFDGSLEFTRNFDETDEFVQEAIPSLLYILASKNLANLIRIHPQKKSCFHIEERRYGLPIFAALATRSYEAVQAFLEAHEQTQSEELPFSLCKWYTEDNNNRKDWGRNFEFSPIRGPPLHVLEKGDEVIFALLLISNYIEAKWSGEHGQTALSYAAAAGWKKVVQLLLLQEGVDVDHKDINGRTPLLLAAIRGKDEIVQLLIDGGADIESEDSNGRTPLFRAASSGKIEVVRLLLATGRIDANAKDRYAQMSPLHYAAESGDRGVVQLLLDKGVNIESKDKSGQTPLSRAASLKHADAVQLLLEKGADVESKDHNGHTPLSHAAVSGAETVIRLLLAKGVNIESRDNEGRTPLSHAACSWWEATVQVLLEKGANTESRDSDGLTPVSHAARSGRDAAIRLLVGSGADLESRDNNGRTPLAHAAKAGMENTTLALLGKSANIESEDDFGLTPLMHAIRSGAQGVVRMLQTHPVGR